MAANDKTELRGLCDTDVVKALDAIALSEGITRTEYIVRLITEDVKRVLHKTSGFSEPFAAILCSRQQIGKTNDYIDQKNCDQTHSNTQSRASAGSSI